VTTSPKHYHIGAAAFDAPSLPSGLYLVATPIGNLGDVTIRALQTLAAADFIYCEDTRVTGKLLERYGIRTPMRNYHEHNAARARPEIIEALQSGKSIALASDAGTPLISDPGFKLVEALVAEGLMVTALPGASAVLTALQLSALPSDRFSFFGFLPEKKSARIAALTTIKSHALTAIIYESPHRVLDTLSDMIEILGDRPVAATRELTKLHEEVIRGTAREVHDRLAAKTSIKGEFAIVIAPAPTSDEPADDETIELAITVALQTLPASKAASTVAKTLNLTKDEIYARILKRKDHGET
jgi:16S rRNA (cytidine1402-2'-O)-methyltransferase